MKNSKKYRKNDKVLVKSYAGPDVVVILKERYIAAESELGYGVDGWNAQIINDKDVDKLRKHGVPYRRGEKPMVWVFDHHIIKKI
jgi:hypothetical protein